MPLFRSSGPAAADDPTSSLRLPASKRVSVAAAERLSTIMEGDKSAQPPPVPLRSSLRNNSSTPAYRSVAASIHQWRHPALRSQETLRSAPPAYASRQPASLTDDEDLTAPVEGEKLARLRRGEQRRSRGGWWRLLLILFIALAIIGLAVGLGVGLTVGRRNSSGDGGTVTTAPGGSTSTESPPPQFPLGEYSFITALRTQQTNCSAKAAAWRCYPYSTFADSNTSSQATFNWIITNTSSSYALNIPDVTSSAGIPANLSISTMNNPFTISFTNQSLTYINDNSNATSPRYAFNFTMSKVVVPSPAITSNNQASQCYFNSTVFTGLLYLSASRTFPDTSLRNSTSLGGYNQWPYAVEITQSSPGGDGVPDCYETINGVNAGRIINGLDPQPESSTCVCDYRNY